MYIYHIKYLHATFCDLEDPPSTRPHPSNIEKSVWNRLEPPGTPNPMPRSALPFVPKCLLAFVPPSRHVTFTPVSHDIK